MGGHPVTPTWPCSWLCVDLRDLDQATVTEGVGGNVDGNPAEFAGVCDCSPTFRKRRGLRKPNTHTRVRTYFV